MSCQEPEGRRALLLVRCRYNRVYGAGRFAFMVKMMREESEISMRAYEIIAAGKVVVPR
jgi:hypothetical protein